MEKADHDTETKRPEKMVFVVAYAGVDVQWRSPMNISRRPSRMSASKRMSITPSSTDLSPNLDAKDDKFLDAASSPAFSPYGVLRTHDHCHGRWFEAAAKKASVQP
ncbi:hypothetical protein FKW77_000626 [Venturia effusa]|uniref:Uncharacterized protein n=1 Tax=Venturia effusa TaxID=50376 RepID=A0A517LHZ2_9PEZI|nr:hypothetical protein FKW77_000626 [Venturia effusa]